jgi:hypothetical protein
LTAKSAEKGLAKYLNMVTLYQRLPSICAKIAYLHDRYGKLCYIGGTSPVQRCRWHRCRAKIVKAASRYFDGMVIFFWWNIWNECNSRTFQQFTKEPQEVAF